MHGEGGGDRAGMRAGFKKRSSVIVCLLCYCVVLFCCFGFFTFFHFLFPYSFCHQAHPPGNEMAELELHNTPNPSTFPPPLTLKNRPFYLAVPIGRSVRKRCSMQYIYFFLIEHLLWKALRKWLWKTAMSKTHRPHLHGAYRAALSIKLGF